jgi:deazaflavin-dependent oxidoreductase (nitroreductase family)
LPQLGLLYRLMRKLSPRLIQNYQKGIGPSSLILLLTTIGRKSGLHRQTPLQYEDVDGVLYTGSARGSQADWFRNIQVNPHVEVQMHDRCFQGIAEPIQAPEQIADFFELRLKRHPVSIGLLMRLEGLPLKFSRADLERFAAQKTMVKIQISN